MLITCKNLKNRLILLVLLTLFLASCKKDNKTEPGGSIGETKQIQWQEILNFNTVSGAGNVVNFAVSDNGNYIFFSNNSKEIYRYNLTNGQTKKLFGELDAMGTSYVHFIDGKLYTTTIFANKSYFGISSDYGDSIEQVYVNTLIPFEPISGFYNVKMNRLFKLPNGTLILPDNASNMNFAFSNDGGRTWARKETELGYTFMPAQNGNRLYALLSGWEGDFGIGDKEALFYSENEGSSWQKSDLKYAPQATDKEGNLIACDTYQFQKLKGGKWTLYEWEGNFPFGVKLRNFNNDQKVVDVEFDNANNLYLLSNNSIYKTKLN